MSSSVPLIDLAPYFDHDSLGGGRARVADEIGRACAEVGFFMIRNHNIPFGVTQAIADASRAFFDLNEAEKLNVAARLGEDRGYRRLQAGTLARSAVAGTQSPPDLRENYFVGPFHVPPIDTLPLEARRYFLANVWPEQVPRMERAFRDYHAAASDLAAHLLRLGAISLDLPENYFDNKLRYGISQLVAVNYPAMPTPPLPGQLRAGAHTDFGSLTLLMTEDKPGGLQVAMQDGEWVDVRPEPGVLVVNLGDLMARWTNDRWRSTLHRVIPPQSDDAAASRRQSIVFFHHPDHDARIECLPTCRSEQVPARYPVTTAGEHLRAKLHQVYG